MGVTVLLIEVDSSAIKTVAEALSICMSTKHILYLF